MKAESVLGALERQLELRDVVAQNRAVAVGELVGPECVDLVQDRGDLVLRRRRRRPLDEPGVPVAHDDGTAEPLHPGERLTRLRAGGDVAEADEPVDLLPLELRQHRLERDQVAMDVRDQPDPRSSGAELAVEIHGGADQRQVRERLREVAEQLAGRRRSAPSRARGGSRT